MRHAISNWAAEGFGFIKARRSSLRRTGLITAIIFFSIALVIAVNSIDLLQINLPALIAYTIIFPPIAILLQVIELRVFAKAGRASFTWSEAVEIVVYARAATLLPVPGGLITRVAALQLKGLHPSKSSLVILLFTGMAGTIAFAYAGIWLVQRSVIGVAFVAIAFAGAAICYLIARRGRVPPGAVALEICVRLASMIFETLAFVAAFAIIGINVAIDQTAVMVVGSFIGLVFNIVPSGIGIREGVVALISPIVGISPAMGFLAAAVVRVVDFIWMGLTAALLLWRGNGGSTAAGEANAIQNRTTKID